MIEKADFSPQNTWKTWIKDGNQVPFLSFYNFEGFLHKLYFTGPDLPYPLSYHRMVVSEDSKAVYVTGGGGRQNSGQLIEMKCSGSTPDTCAFKPSATTNRVDRESHIALPITESLATKLCT